MQKIKQATTYFFTRHWVLMIVSLISFLAAFGVRLIEYPKWQNDMYRIGNEYLMATHDAYAWLAGAVNVGGHIDSPLAYLAKIVSFLTATSPGFVGFWAPAVFAGFTAVAIALWGWKLGSLPAGLFAGMLGAAAPGFFFRTRLGFFDTDIITLLFPLLITLFLAIWISPYLKTTWFFWKKTRGSQVRPVEHAVRTIHIPAVLIAAFSLFCMPWHHDIKTFLAMAFVLVLILIVLLGVDRKSLLLGLALYGIAVFFGIYGLLVSVALTAVLYFRTDWQDHPLAIYFIYAVLALLCLNLLIFGPFQGVFHKILLYLKTPTEVTGKNQSLDYPGIIQSVREAQNIPWEQVLRRLAPFTWLAVVGIAGFFYVVWKRPLALLLLPLGLVSLTAVKLGNRMTMFGGPVVFLGLSLPLFWMFHNFLHGVIRHRKAVLLSVGFLAAGILLYPWFQSYKKLQPMPIISKAHAAALKQMEKRVTDKSMFWTWWDYGYATKYYAGARSFADGARHGGPHVFTLGRIMTTPSPLLANQLIKFSALHEYEPWEAWDLRPADRVMSHLDNMSRTKLSYDPSQDQYLVVTWDNFNLVSWITYYGTWDLTKKDGTKALAALIRETIQLDKANGILHLKKSRRSLPLKSVDFITEGSREMIPFPSNTSRLRLLVNTVTGSAMLMDDLAYHSSMVQLLLLPADDPIVTQYFDLVIDEYPHVRIYKVR